jgi:MoxR-like ATPase
MLPSDIVGSEVVDQKTGDFRIHRGPVFTNLLLADEINRAAPKVQGAMLEAMQERKVTLGGQTMRLPTPFLVIATQNPVEQSGTFELPEAQLDRFMLLHRLGYPGRDEEQDILQRQLGMGLRKEEGGAVPKTAFDMIDDSPVGTKAPSNSSGARANPRTSTSAAVRAPAWPSSTPPAPARSSAAGITSPPKISSNSPRTSSCTVSA